MTSLPGGAADKLGNRYEHWWTALRVGDVLEGRAARIRLERPGSGGFGVEFEVDEGGGTIGEQVKDASSGGTWTFKRLTREGVLTAAKSHVSAGRSFRLVVSTAARELAALSDRARKTETIGEYLEVLTDDLTADLQNLAATWNVATEDAWTLLKRVYVEHHTVESMRRLAAATFKLLFADDPGVVTAELRRFCEDHLHESLTGPKIWAHLESRGFRRRLLVGDAGVVDGLHRTVERHKRRIARSVPSIGLVVRGDTDCVLDRLRAADGGQIMVLDGRAGFGKSTVVSTVASALEAEGWFVAVARMDGVDATTNTSDKLGAAIGLAESPTVLLAGVADGAPALLVIDQLDAVSTYSGRMADTFDAVDEVLDEINGAPNIKVLLVVRTVDLHADTRLRGLVATPARVERHTVGPLSIGDVKNQLAAAGRSVPTSEPTLDLLRTPLHLSVFSRLSDTAREGTYRTLQDLYDEYTDEVRRGIEDRVGHLDWLEITGALVAYMNDNEVLTAPATELDGASVVEVGALESESVIVQDDGGIAFFHESYFDYLFARAFVGSGRDLHGFLAASGQYLFRRAQTRQVLEHLAATDRPRFREVVAQLLGSPEIRSHLKEVVAGVLAQLDPVSDDWAAIDEIAWHQTPIAKRLLGLLSRPGWFDAADATGKWERWLADPDTVATAFHQLAIAARERPLRADELVRPYIGASEDWRLRLRFMIQWSLQPALIDLTVELIVLGQLDDARGPIAVNSDFWSILYGLERDDPAGTARVIGAYLRRGLVRATAEGFADPFASKHLSTHSQSGSLITDVAKAAPAAFVEHVLPFVIDVALADQFPRENQLPASRRWGFRHRSANYNVDDAVFVGVADALRKLAFDDPARCDVELKALRDADSDELRYLACRALAVRGAAEDAVEWLIADQRNLVLGWSDSPHWASRELIETCSQSCSEEVFGHLEDTILRYSATWERRQSHGHAQYELLSAMDRSRLSDGARRRLGELERRFPHRPPEPPQPIMAHFVEPPIGDESSKRMSDDDWLRALRKHSEDETDWRGSVPVGGGPQLGQVLGRRAQEDPARFGNLALRMGDDIPAAATDQIIWNIAGNVDVDVLTEVCDHANRLHGAAVGRAICRAAQKMGPANSRIVALIESYSDDPDPDHESARTDASSGQLYYGGDLYTAGINSTRGEAALAAASILFATDEHLDRLLPVVEKLATDDILAVRVCAAEGVVALLNHVPDRALAAAERLFDTSIDVHDAHTAERLLVFAVLRDPDRFGATLVRALRGPDPVAKRAGRVWAVATLRDAIPPTAPLEVSQLPAPARSGAAEVFAGDPDRSIKILKDLFDDDDADVRKCAAQAVHRLEDVGPEEVDELVGTFTSSAAFGEHFEGLIRALETSTTTLPQMTINACERAVEIAGGDLSNIASAQSLAGRSLVVVVLRLYRQGHADLRVRCLDLIDRLTELNAYGVAEVLQTER